MKTLESPAPRTWPWLVLIFAVSVCARLSYVHHFASALPFWDEWDAEGDMLLRPLIEQSLSLGDLLHAHNEHRILPSKLLSLLSFSLSGEWNSLNNARFDAFLFSLIPAFFFWFLARGTASLSARIFLLLAVTATALLPFDWENFLIGFQSQFYFLVVFALLAFSLAVAKPDKPAAIVGLCLLCILDMASGILVPPAVAGIYVVRSILDRGHFRIAASMTAAMAALAVAGYLSMPVIPGHQALKAQSAGEFVTALGHVLAWPANRPSALLAIWLPAAARFLYLMAKRGKASPQDLFALGCWMWSLGQALAIAYSRGHQLAEVPSRYLVTLVPGLLANAWFAFLFLQSAFRAIPRLRARHAAGAAISLAFFACSIGGLILRTPADWQAMQGRHEALRTQAAHVACYLDTRDPRCLDVPFFQIPYPDADRLRGMLDNPALRSVLDRCAIATCPTPQRS